MTDVRDLSGLDDDRVLFAGEGDVIAAPDDERPAFGDPAGDDEWDRELP